MSEATEEPTPDATPAPAEEDASSANGEDETQEGEADNGGNGEETSE